MKLPFSRKDRALGVTGRRRYDLPLNRGTGTGFLVLLIGLMTFLAMLALSASFALSDMTARWSTGLENQVTVEIPATDDKGEAVKPEDVKAMTGRLAAILAQHPDVAEAHTLTDEEIAELVRPWLGDEPALAHVPVPGLINLTLKEVNDNTYKVLANRIASVDPRAHLDTHEDWLKDVLRFTGALQFAAALLTIVIGATTAAAVAGAVRARMAVNKDDIEILHLMGASDTYIGRQFQRHSLVLALSGGIGGMVTGAVALRLIGWISGRMEVNLLPGFNLSGLQTVGLAALPLAVALIAVAAAGHTVRRVLTRLP